MRSLLCVTVRDGLKREARSVVANTVESTTDLCGLRQPCPVPDGYRRHRNSQLSITYLAILESPGRPFSSKMDCRLEMPN
jgi:hypothetical protein